MKKFLFSIFALPVVVVAADTNGLPALIPAYGELPPTFWEQHQAAFIVAGFAIIAIGFLFLRMWLRPKTPVILSPLVLARQTLAGLQGQPEDGKVLSEVSQCLRRYFSDNFNLPNQELTTAEFCAVIGSSPQIRAELAENISSFLRECDVRKFSPAKSAQPINAASRAFELVALAEKQREEIPATQ
jgi:hypothetical protein